MSLESLEHFIFSMAVTAGLVAVRGLSGLLDSVHIFRVYVRGSASVYVFTAPMPRKILKKTQYLDYPRCNEFFQ
jgi:hypothetical protein